MKASLTIDAESVYKSITSKDFKVPTEKTLLGHISWIREFLDVGILSYVHLCDTRNMTADGLTKGSIDRQLLIEVMLGIQNYKHDVKSLAPFRSSLTKDSPPKPTAHAQF